MVIRGLFCFPVSGTIAQIFGFYNLSRLWLYLLAASALHSFCQTCHSVSREVCACSCFCLQGHWCLPELSVSDTATGAGQPGLQAPLQRGREPVLLLPFPYLEVVDIVTSPFSTAHWGCGLTCHCGAGYQAPSLLFPQFCLSLHSSTPTFKM